MRLKQKDLANFKELYPKTSKKLVGTEITKLGDLKEKFGLKYVKSLNDDSLIATFRNNFVVPQNVSFFSQLSNNVSKVLIQGRVVDFLGNLLNIDYHLRGYINYDEIMEKKLESHEFTPMVISEEDDLYLLLLAYNKITVDTDKVKALYDKAFEHDYSDLDENSYKELVKEAQEQYAKDIKPYLDLTDKYLSENKNFDLKHALTSDESRRNIILGSMLSKLRATFD